MIGADALNPSLPLLDPPVGQVEVGPPAVALVDLPAALDRVAVVHEAAREALIEGFSLAPEPPLAVADRHLVDAADVPVVRVELVVAPIGGVGAHDADAVRRLGHLDLRALDQQPALRGPLEAGPRLARPGIAAGWDRLQVPVTDQGLERFEGGFSGWLIHRASSTRPARRPA